MFTYAPRPFFLAGALPKRLSLRRLLPWGKDVSSLQPATIKQLPIEYIKSPILKRSSEKGYGASTMSGQSAQSSISRRQLEHGIGANGSRDYLSTSGRTVRFTVVVIGYELPARQRAKRLFGCSPSLEYLVVSRGEIESCDLSDPPTNLCSTAAFPPRPSL